MFEVPAHRSTEPRSAPRPCLADQVPNRVLVGRAEHVLLDDGPFVQLLRRVMCRGADQLTPRSAAGGRACRGERRQESGEY